MFERMLNKQVTPSIEEMTEFCGENYAIFLPKTTLSLL